MNRQSFKYSLAATALGVVLGVSAGASADTMDSTVVHASALPTEVVTYKRSELATDEGRAAVERRLRHAAEGVCGSTDLRIAGSLSAVADRQQCAKQAVDRAMSQIGADQVATID